MRFQILNVTYHDFKSIKSQGNVVITKCTCCQRPRLAVYLQTEIKKIFFYSGYDEQIAQMHFSSLIKHQNQ